MERRVPVVLALAGIATSLALTLWVLWLCGHGLDFSDEGLYLNWIATPGAYAASVTQFGFVYHPLAELAGGSIAWMRRLNMLLSLGLAWALAFALLRLAARQAEPAHPGRRLDAVLALVAATSVFAQLGVWLPTPSYNTLTLQALLLAATAFVLTRWPTPRVALAGFALLGVAGAFAFLGKPTTAAMLAVLGVLAVAWPSAAGWPGPVLAIGAALLTLATVFFGIDGQLAGTLRRYTDGLALAQLMASDYDPAGVIRLETLIWPVADRWWVAAVGAGVALATVIASSTREQLSRIGSAAPIAFAAVTVGATLREVPADWYGHIQRGLWTWALLGAAALAVPVLAWRAREWRSLRSGALVAGWLSLLPAAFAFGTGNNLWYVAGLACCFWSLGALALLAPVSLRLGTRRPLFVLAFGAQAIAAVIAAMAAQTPYRQRTPLPLQEATVQVHGNSTLVVEDGAARYIRDLTDAARRGGLQAGTSLIDLTGRTPTAAYILAARAPGQAWLLGGYPGSDSYAAVVLRTVGCDDIARAWLLVDSGSGSISPGVLLESGATLDDYMLLDKFPGPILYEPGAVKPAEAGLHRLYAPKRPADVARIACERARLGQRREPGT